MELPALQHMAREEPPGCSGQQIVSVPSLCEDLMCFVVMSVHTGRADCSHLDFIARVFLLLVWLHTVGLSSM